MSESRPAFPGLVNLASARLGAAAAQCSDEFFAPLSRMLADGEPIFVPDKYDNHGKWMDGWETRRRRDGGGDWATVRLAARGAIRHLDLDTRHFTGNFPPAAEVFGCDSGAESADSINEKEWISLLPKSELRGDSHNFFELKNAPPVNWLRLNIYPDGGIARLRAYGLARPDWDFVAANNATPELSAALNGGRILGYNDAHYGDPQALIAPGRGATMGDGWETRRRRTPGSDWIVVALGRACLVKKMEVDTAHFKGNYPARCSVQAAFVPSLETAAAEEVLQQAEKWPEILSPQPLQADSIHCYESEIAAAQKPVNAARLNIHPDGGVSRFRVFGAVAE